MSVRLRSRMQASSWRAVKHDACDEWTPRGRSCSWKTLNKRVDAPTFILHL